MLEFYFENPITIERLRAGPSGRFMDSFSGGLKKAGYSWWTARVFLRAADHIGRYAETQGRDIGGVDWGTLTSFETHLPTCSCPGSSRCKTIDVVRGAKHFIDHLRENDILKIPAVDDEEKIVAPLVLDFQSWLRTHRGLSESTVGHYSQAASQFVTDHGEDASCYDAKTLREFVLDRAKTQGHGATKTLISGLRMFMRFLASQGLCRSNLDKAIPAVAFWRLTTIPRSLQNHDVERILDACDATSPMGLRDRAIILLFARLGLRAGDIAGLHLDDLDWKDGSILVSGKSRRQARLPLSQEVGDAILEYLEHRPRSDAREVFLRSVAPFRALRTGGSASQVVTRAMRRAGITASCYGAHALRHTAACEMIRQGVSLYEIGEVLRHKSVEMTAHYAKIDVGLLKQVALPWPEVK
jgi:site-specific recombinase XerD